VSILFIRVPQKPGDPATASATVAISH
jgi:hypothetical protein